MSERDELIEKNRRQRELDTLVKGKESDYWRLLEEWIIQEIEKEQRFMDSFKDKGITDRNKAEYNRSVDQVYFIRKLLNVNDVLIDERISFLEKAKDFVEEAFTKATSFMDLSGNGQK